MRSFAFFFASALLFLGIGCTNPLAVSEKAATDISVTPGTQITLEETTVGFDNPLTKEDVTEVTVTQWESESAEIAWKKTTQQETPASKDARQQAMNTPVGSGVAVPEVQYEEVVIEGSIRADGMSQGTHLKIPAMWEAGAIDLTGEGSSLIWLSRGQYESLVNTRNATVTIGNIDTFIATLLSYSARAADFINVDALTTITAEGEWGSYTLLFNGEKVKVQTVVAENAFARFEILAHPESPLVLSVVPRPASWVMTALETLHPQNALEGYRVTEIKN